jgi:hypothetical protein
MHFLEDEEELPGPFADNPQSLEGRLLFAVPKSESPQLFHRINLTYMQREDYYKQHLIS